MTSSETNKGKMTPRKQNSKCGKCNLNVTNGQKGMQCDVCNKWTHIRCLNMSEKTYEMYGEDKELNWICKKCVTEKIDQVTLTEIMKEMKEEMKVMRKEMEDIRATRDDLKEVKQQLQTKKEKEKREKSERAELISLMEGIKEEMNISQI